MDQIIGGRGAMKGFLEFLSPLKPPYSCNLTVFSKFPFQTAIQGQVAEKYSIS